MLKFLSVIASLLWKLKLQNLLIPISGCQEPSLPSGTSSKLADISFIPCKIDSRFYSGSHHSVLLSSPFILISALLVRLTSHGPAFYTQMRLGLNGSPMSSINFARCTMMRKTVRNQVCTFRDNRVTRWAEFCEKVISMNFHNCGMYFVVKWVWLDQDRNGLNWWYRLKRHYLGIVIAFWSSLSYWSGTDSTSTRILIWKVFGKSRYLIAFTWTAAVLAGYANLPGTIFYLVGMPFKRYNVILHFHLPSRSKIHQKLRRFQLCLFPSWNRLN